jgi:formylmethanofuran dehydrogenase subunit B
VSIPPNTESQPLRIIENFACTACGCVCDDLRLTVSGNRIVRAERACEIAEPWLLAQNSVSGPVAEIAGQPVPFGNAIDESVRILREAQYPLVYGLAQSNTAGQRAAVSLAERLGGVIDTTASVCHAPSVMAQQQVGKVTCTLGEVRNRADLVVFWGSDPITTHPRHWERYSVHPTGRSIPRGRQDRFVVVADTTRTASAAAADLYIPIEPGRHFEALFTLRAMVREAIPAGRDCPGVPAPLLADLARRMKQSRSGTMFFGVDLARGDGGHCNVQALLLLVTDLNAWGRWCAMRMRVQGNVVGADSVLTWQTSYPFAVDMSRGYPRYNPGEFSVQGVLERKEVDACLLIGSETLNWLPDAALDHLRAIPTVVLDPPGREAPLSAAVRFRTATAGVHTSGTVYRMDSIPVPLRAALPSPYPSDAEVLKEIERKLESAEAINDPKGVTFISPGQRPGS